MTQHEMLYSWC